MPLEPGYGETPLSDDELNALLPHVVATLGTPVSKADVFDLESAVLQDVAEGLLAAVFNRELTLDELLTDQFLPNGPHANSALSPMPKLCASIHLRMGMVARQGFTPIWCSSRRRTHVSISTTGTLTSIATSNCFETSTGIAMSPR